MDLIKYFTNNAKDFHYPCKSQVLFLQLLIEKYHGGFIYAGHIWFPGNNSFLGSLDWL